MNSTITRSLLAAAIVAAIPVAVQASQASDGAAIVSSSATSTGPIQLNTVTIQPSAGWQNNFAYPGRTVISFTNRNASPVVDVVFALRGGHNQYIGRIEDVGNYAHGQTVSHAFVNNEIEPNQSLDVEQVTFADGSLWTNSGWSAPISRRQAR